MKKSELVFTAILVPMDFIMLVLAGVSAYYIRFAEVTADIRPVIFSLPFEEYFKIIFFVATAWIIIFAIAGLYKISVSTKIIEEIYKIILACSTGLVTVIIYMFFQRELFSSRFIILASWILAILYVVIARIAIRWLQRNLYVKGYGIHRVAVVGNTSTTERLTSVISQSHKLGLNIVKRIREVDEKSLAELQYLAKEKRIDEIMQIDSTLTKDKILALLDICDENHILYKYAADILGTKILKTEVHVIAGLPIMEVKVTPLDGWGKINKRTFDFIASLAAIIIFSPILTLSALLIKLDSKGPIIYKNERVSKDGFFSVYKFRSMYQQYCINEKNQAALEYEQQLIETQNTKIGPLYKIKHDPRVTRIGRLLRRWSIDELPQFFNVLLGNMSLVGPRPHQPREVENYKKHHKKVLAIKPGVTGLAQISGRSDLSFDEEVRLDIYYIENWSLLRDISIILRTPLAILKRRKAE